MANPKKEIGREIEKTAKELQELDAARADLMRASLSTFMKPEYEWRSEAKPFMENARKHLRSALKHEKKFKSLAENIEKLIEKLRGAKMLIGEEARIIGIANNLAFYIQRHLGMVDQIIGNLDSNTVGSQTIDAATKQLIAELNRDVDLLKAALQLEQLLRKQTSRFRLF